MIIMGVVREEPAPSWIWGGTKILRKEGNIITRN
jgi:hypothetical protein